MYKSFATLIAILHIIFMAVFLSALVISLQDKLDEYTILQIWFWTWISAKVIFYLIFRRCALTTFEQYLRRLSGKGSYTGGFIKHYLKQSGIHVNDATVVVLVVAPIIVGMLSELGLI